MDTEAIGISGSPPVKGGSPRPPNAAGNVSLGSGGGPKANVAGNNEDVVSISPQARTQSPQPAKVSDSTTTKMEVVNKQVVMQIVDSNTGQVVREIPDAKQQELSQAIQDTVSKMVKSPK